MKSDNGRGRVWKIRKSRIDRLGKKVVFVYEGMQLIGDELKQLGRDLVKKSVVRREKRHSHDLFEEAIAASFVEDVEKIITFSRLYKHDGSDWVGFRDKSAVDDIDISKLKGGER